MNAAMAQGGRIPPGLAPVTPAVTAPQPSGVTSADAAFQQLFAEFMRLQGELAVEKSAYKMAHPVFALFKQSLSNPLRQACQKNTQTLKEKHITPTDYEKVATSILPKIKPIISPAIAQIYGDLIQQTLVSHPPRDAADQSFFQVVNPMLKDSQKAQSMRFEMPFPEGSMEGLVGYYLIGYEVEWFAELWQTTIGRYPSGIREKEVRATALGKELVQKYPNEFAELSGGLESFRTAPQPE